MPDTKAEPCPWCKSEPKIESEKKFIYDHKGLFREMRDYYVLCPLCEARGPSMDMEGAAVVLWNTMSQLAAKFRDSLA